ncbi:MAG: SDR family oxidoreductase [Rhodospirillales bacterium]
MPASKNAVVIVTGASRGIGAAIACRAAETGYSVIVNYSVDRTGADNVVEGIISRGGRALPVQANIRNEEDIIRLFDAAENEFGPITALVNNAGIAGPAVPVTEIYAEDLRDLLNVNLYGPFLCAREAVRRMTPHGRGSIVNVSSTAAVGGGAGRFVAYAATKAGLETMTIGLAREAGPLGIRINAIQPGRIESGMANTAAQSEDIERFIQSVPLRRLGLPEEAANAVLWLLSEEASYVNGAVVPISGGR